MTRLRKLTLSLVAVIFVLGFLSILKLTTEMGVKVQSLTQVALMSSSSATVTPQIIEFTPATNATSTVTLTPEPLTCLATVIGGERILWQLPTRGLKEGSINLSNGAEVVIANHTSDFGWLPVSFGNQLGWVRNDFVKYEQDCVSKLPISNLMSLFQNTPVGYKTMYEDTFYDDHGDWLDRGNRKITARFPDEFGDYYLSIYAGAQDLQGARLVVKNLRELHDFELQISVSPLTGSIAGDRGYFAIRFRVSEDAKSYYELRILRRCDIQLFSVREYSYTLIYNTQLKFSSESSSCNDSIEEYIRLSVGNNEVKGQINDLRLPIIQTSDPDGVLASGGIELISSDAKVRLYFLTITTPE